MIRSRYLRFLKCSSPKINNYLKSQGILISMDGKGRATDNAFIERLWRSVKYEKVYLNPPNDGIELYEDLKDYFHFYNEERRHQALDDEIPGQVYRAAQKAAA